MTDRPPFVVFALPRSRTYWLSRFLTVGGWFCSHDEVRHVRSVADVRSWLSQERVGTVETAAAPFWRLLIALRPDVRVAIVRRPLAEVLDSLMATGIAFDRVVLERHLGRAASKLDTIARHIPGTLSVDFADLATEATCQQLYEHCLGLPHDHDRWAQFDAVNLQVDLAAELRYMRAYRPQLRRAEGACVQQIHSLLRDPHVRLNAPDSHGVSIQEESLETFMRDGQALFAEHCVAVGEAPDEWTRKNIPMIQALAEGGYWQFMTARSNGRMLGYLQTLVGPSVEKIGRLSGTQGLFFVSADAAGLGLGLKLQRASIAALRQRGVAEVFMREGVRGSGPRIGVLFRRLGAEANGHLYRLKLQEAA